MGKLLHRSLGIFAVAVVAAAFTFGGVSAEEKKKGDPKPAACNSMKEQVGCAARTDCSWIAASVDSKTGKEKRKAYCRAKPKAKAKA